MRDLYRCKAAVSTVVAAILVMAVVTTFITALNAYYIPSLATDHEIKHMQDVRGSFVELAARSSSGTDGARIQVPLGDGGVPFISSLSTSGTITTKPDHGWINISLFNSYVVKDTFEFTNNSSYRMDNITGLSRISLTMEKPLVDDNFSIVTSMNDSINVVYSPNGYLKVTTYKNASEVIFNSYVETPQSWPVNTIFSLDILDPVYGFSGLLDEYQSPFNVTINGSSSGSFYIDYDKLNYSDNEFVYNCNYTSMNVSTGYVKYSSSNNFWMDQNYIMENGAVILEQASRSSMRSEPYVVLDESRGLLNIYVFDLVGVDNSISGNGEAVLNVWTDNDRSYSYPFVENISIAVKSLSPEAWESYFLEFSGNVSVENETVHAIFYNRSVKVSSRDVMVYVP